MNEELMKAEELEVIQQSLSICFSCRSTDCTSCAVRVRPWKLVHLANSYSRVLHEREQTIALLKDQLKEFGYEPIRHNS